MDKVYDYHISAPEAPQSLRAISIEMTNITIEWDKVNCRERNGGIHSYTVYYYLTSNSSRRTSRLAVDTGVSDTILQISITRLLPRTSYTLEVWANNSLIREPGAIATINVSTTTPRSKECFNALGTCY